MLSLYTNGRDLAHSERQGQTCAPKGAPIFRLVVVVVWISLSRCQHALGTPRQFSTDAGVAEQFAHARRVEVNANSAHDRSSRRTLACVSTPRRQSTPASLLLVGAVLGVLAALLIGSTEEWSIPAALLTAAGGSFWFVGLVAIGVRMGTRD